MRNVVITGGSIAAVTTADALRQAGHDGTITLLSAETHAPYLRPPLSKGVLKGTEDVASTAIDISGLGVEVVLGTRATGLDRDRSRVLLADGEEVPYDGLVIATGARARRLAGDDGDERVIRDLDDALALKEELLPGRRLIVVGGGFLGMEAASTARALGLEVTVVDVLPHLERQFGPILAAHMTAAARERGVSLVHSPAGVHIEDASRVTLGDGRTLVADLVLSAVGDVPNVEWLTGTGLAEPAGVRTDSRCRVAPGIVAAGDAALVRTDAGAPRRTPHWGAAIDQARTAAFALVRGEEAPAYAPRPYLFLDRAVGPRHEDLRHDRHGRRDGRPRGLAGGGLRRRAVPRRRAAHRRGLDQPPHADPAAAAPGRRGRRRRRAARRVRRMP